jgi:hypothetical protein
MTWREQSPDPAMLAVLEAVGPRPLRGTQTEKRKWGTAFADACAVMVANEMRLARAFGKLEIRPEADGSGRESLTGVAGGGKKKVDVIASTLSSGLQVGVSLKAENFPSQVKTGSHFGKNVTNRIYELNDEVRAIHDYQPRAIVVGLFFLPIQAVSDREKRSSFARAVGLLRARTGRIDPSSSGQLNKLDACFIGLYVAETIDGGPERGVVRYFDVHRSPPRLGRPKIETTMNLAEAVGMVAASYEESSGEIPDYAEPEEDDWEP